MTQLILASSSPYRKALLENIGIRVDTVSPDIDESPRLRESPTLLSKRLAEQKAAKVSAVYPDAIVIGSDQVAMINIDDTMQLLGKPGSAENALQQLMLCQGQTVHFYTALSLRCENKNIRCTEIEETVVTFKTLKKESLSAYIEKEQPLDCAGSFKCEGLGILLFDSISSRDPNALVGLPLILLNTMLFQHFGVDLLTVATQR
jgi:septum formation protein